MFNMEWNQEDMEGVDLTYSTQWKGNSGPDWTI